MTQTERLLAGDLQRKDAKMQSSEGNETLIRHNSVTFQRLYSVALRWDERVAKVHCSLCVIALKKLLSHFSNALRKMMKAAVNSSDCKRPNWLAVFGLDAVKTGSIRTATKILAAAANSAVRFSQHNECDVPTSHGTLGTWHDWP